MPVSAPRPLAYGCSETCCCCGTSNAAAARNVATISAKYPRPRRLVRTFYLLLKKHLAQLVLLARLEDGEHLVAGLQLGRSDGDLRLPVAHDRDQPRPLRQAQLLDRLPGAR